MAKYRIDPAASNMTILGVGDAEILFSYRTPVAAFIPGNGYVRTDKFHSTTTSKHINRWIGPNAEVVSQDYLENLIEGL